jgi:hypothetical protein
VKRRRRAAILAVVLVLVSILALVMASYLYFVEAETSGVDAYSAQQQARLAAESGFEELTAVLRAERSNVTAWFDVPKRFRHALVWAQGYNRESDPLRRQGSRRELLTSGEPIVPAWRYSVVAPRLDGPPGTVRFGVTPEAARLNINRASEQQIRALFLPLLNDLGVQEPERLIACLLDWLDADDEPREGGAESDYYNTLTPPYNCKNGPLDTIEELLLIKGFSAAILYGEDTNRNGILDANEDDGDASAPEYDNQDGNLNLGLAPFLTVHSRELDAALDNRPRINLNVDVASIQAAMEAQLADGELSVEARQFILTLKQGGFNFAQLDSPARLYVDDVARATADAAGAAGGTGGAGSESGAGGARNGAAIEESDDGGQQPPPPETPRRPRGPQAGAPPGRAGRQPGALRGGAVRVPGSPAGGGGGGVLRIPDELRSSPITLEDLPVLMDRFSTRPVAQAGAPVFGLVNINAAPARVLQVVRGMTPEAAAAIVNGRSRLDAQALRTSAWPLTSGMVDSVTFYAIAPHITTKAHQFHVEIVGYADHLRVMRRYEWVVEMLGPLMQIRYSRDLGSLGFAWPVDDERVVVSGG